jgi:polysaccharide biosynthesis PFTS motif protein
MKLTIDRKIILTSKIKHYWLLTCFKVYGRRSLLSIHHKGAIIVESDIFSASDNKKCSNEASSIEEHLLTIFVNNSRTKFLSEWGGDEYAKYFIGRAVLQEARKVFLAFRYAEKVCKKYNIHKNVYIWSDSFSWKVYKEIRNVGLLSKNIKLHPLLILYIKANNIAKYMFFFIKSLFYLESQVLKMKGCNASNKHYKNIVHLDDALLDNGQNPIITDKIFKLFSKDSSLFLNDTGNNYKWEGPLLKSRYSVLKLDNIVLQMTRRKYLSMYYIGHFVFRAKLLFLSWSSPWLMSSCYRALRFKVLWEVFYYTSSASNVIRMMVQEDLTSSVIHRKHKAKTIFTYFSVSENVVDKKIDNSKSSSHDYTHMISDYIISNQISNTWLKTHESSVGKYIELGPIFSDIVRDNFHYRNELLSQLNIPNNVKVVSFLDNSFGHMGVFTISAYNAFIEALLSLSKINKNIFFLFKSKKSLEYIATNASKKSEELIKKIRSGENTIYVNDHNIDSLKLMSISDLIVSAPMSSVLHESLFGGVKAITYDPVAQYKKYSIVSVKFKKVYATSFIELEELMEYWLTFAIDKKVECYLLNSVYQNFDGVYYECFINKYQEFINGNLSANCTFLKGEASCNPETVN